MVQGTPFLLLLCLALVASGFPFPKCVLTGTWINDLHSTMVIGAVDNGGNFNGVYHTAVTATSNKILKSPLKGSQHSANTKSQPTFGFTVNWNFSDSVTVFTGQCFVDKNGKEVLKTMWLLRSHADTIGDDWKATLVGTNVFRRTQHEKE
ncbi:avidin-like [Pogoniulus pusillus]|uniref:avidin-like n=1 Tax=Pogoniulus pusillus TaxID=488313 RepID=UPI0030B95840